MKVKKDEYGVKIKYPDRSCHNCGHYPCFTGIEKCSSDFGAYGCQLYSKKRDGSSGTTSGIS